MVYNFRLDEVKNNENYFSRQKCEMECIILTTIHTPSVYQFQNSLCKYSILFLGILLYLFISTYLEYVKGLHSDSMYGLLLLVLLLSAGASTDLGVAVGIVWGMVDSSSIT